MSEEFRNYRRRCLNPLFALSAATGFVTRAFGSGIARLLPGSRYWFQDRRINRLRHELLGHDTPVAVLQPQAGAVVRRSLILAVGSFELTADLDWLTVFPDDEVTISLHRWNWLLRGLTDDPVPLTREQGLILMRSWIQQCREQADLTADAYSTGERIVNGTLFLLLTGDGAGDAKIPHDLAAAFRQMGRQVASNLEYYRGDLTGNHAFNNARALLFAGLAAQLPSAVDLSFAISAERLSRLVTADGFMRECSSHYHLLFTRWVLEMLWICELKQHSAFVLLLRPYARLLVQRCWFFLVRGSAAGSWTIPLMGDVSPDFPPEWLLGLPWSSLACAVYRPDELPEAPLERGWSDLFGLSGGTRDTPRVDALASFPNSGWLRIDHAPWTMFVRAEARDGGLRADHAHHDLGGFVLFHAGDPLLVDIGRLDYTSSSAGLYGKGAAAHNSLLIDGLGSTCDGPNWLSRRYRSVRVATELERHGDMISMTLRHDGFSRLARGPADHERRFELSRHSVQIQDRLAGKGIHRLRARFHFAAGVEPQRSSAGSWRMASFPLCFASAALPDVEVQIGRDSPPFGGWYFPVYGRRLRVTTLDFSGAVEFPAAVTYSVIPEV